MKRIKFFAVALTALAMVSCSKETDLTANVPQGMPATLSLKISGSNPNSRATGVADEGTEAQVNRVAVLVFRADGNLDGKGEFEAVALTGLTTPVFNITSGTRSIYVVANAPAGAFAAVDNKEAFFAIKESLSTQTTSNLTMSGEWINVILNPGANSLGQEGQPGGKFTISRIASRVKLSWTLPDVTSPYHGKITVDKVYMLNTMSEATYASDFGSTSISSTLKHGISSTPILNLQPSGTWAATPYLVETNPTSGNVYFYAFGNGATSPTKIVIEATYNDGVSPKIVYYPITINKANANTSINGGTAGTDGAHTYIQRNNRYAVSATINGLGADSPWEEIIPATLSLTVAVAEWPAEIVQAITFN